MARTYNRDSKGRFAPTGGVKVTAAGRRANRRGYARINRVSGRTTERVDGHKIQTSRKHTATQRGKVGAYGARALRRPGRIKTKQGALNVNVNSVVTKIRNRRPDAKGPSAIMARNAAQARGVQIRRNAKYVSRTEAAARMGPLRPVGRAVTRRTATRNVVRGTPPRSGYIVTSTVTTR